MQKQTVQQTTKQTDISNNGESPSDRQIVIAKLLSDLINGVLKHLHAGVDAVLGLALDGDVKWLSSKHLCHVRNVLSTNSQGGVCGLADAVQLRSRHDADADLRGIVVDRHLPEINVLTIHYLSDHSLRDFDQLDSNA